MKKLLSLLLILICLVSCKTEDDTSPPTVDDGSQSEACTSANFPDWSSSSYVLPYAVGKTYNTGLTACTSSYHGPGSPDQYAIDFNMPIGDEIRASVGGQVVYVRESGQDYAFPNNLVIVQHGNVYVQYMHLTKDGAEVEVGDFVQRGSLIGYSGATGLAGYPHLHFVVTNGLEYPYESVPVTFSNTTPNPMSLESGQPYLAESY